MYSIQKATLDEIANAIKEKTGKEEKISPIRMPDKIRSIQAKKEDIIPDDGNTRIFIHLEEGRTSPILCCCPNGTVTVDWGDNTEPYLLSGKGISSPVQTPIHEYSKPGNYIITLIVNGEVGFIGNGTYGCQLLCWQSTPHVKNYVYSTAIQKIILGNSVNLSESVNGFYNLNGLQSVTISNAADSSIASLCFSYCYGLANVFFSSDIASIEYNAFTGCYGVKFYDFSKCTSIPTLSNYNAFNNMADDCEIRVPASLYNDWISATNWSTYADQIVAIEEE